MPDVSSDAARGSAPVGRVRRAQVLDRRRDAAAGRRQAGGVPDRDDRAAIRRFIDRQGGPEGLSVCYEAGPGGFALWRLLDGDRRRVRRGRAVADPGPRRRPRQDRSPRREEARRAVSRRAAVVRAAADAGDRGAAGSDALPRRSALRADRGAQPGAKQLLRHGRIFRDGKTAWTQAAPRVDRPPAPRRPLAQAALEQMLIHLDGIDRQLDTLDARARADRPQRAVGRPGADPRPRFRGIATLTALGLIAEIGDFARFSHPRELARLARDRPQRVLLRRSAAPRAHHPDRQPPRPPAADRGRLALPPRAPAARPRARSPTSAPGKPRSACTTATATSPTHGKRSTVANVAVARELVGFLWAAMTNQPPHHAAVTRPAPGGRRLTRPPTPTVVGPGGRCDPPGGSSTRVYAIPTRDASTRQLTTGHCPAVPTRASQSDSRRCRSHRPPGPTPPP